MHIRRWLVLASCIAACVMLAGCGFHLRRSAALPSVMAQQVYLKVEGGGAFARSLAAALRASKVDVLDAPAEGVPTLDVTTAAFSSRLLTSGYQRVGEYDIGMHVEFNLKNGDGVTLIPAQTIDLSHEFAVDQTQFSAITSETESIHRSLVREMTDAVMRRLEAHAGNSVPPPPPTR
ncbi:MAG TPA: LPS assembly lipoprotein LptE [Rhodanobacteraceae bacterium]|jgi:LPS-assembly lipoprotein|nr:LPS assembly lipoprotein LptE [Rhodanobacteraceae bacterium]